MNRTILSMDYLRAFGNTPRVHGNGFIQLDLDQDRRLNIWGHPNIPRQQVDTSIHDHTFGFKSTIMVGRLVNRQVIFQNLDQVRNRYQVYVPQVREGEDTILLPTNIFGYLKQRSMQLLVEGDTYHMQPFEFHETFTDRPSATLMEKTSKPPIWNNPTKARVLVRADQKPDNDFNRNSVLSVADLWFIIDDVLHHS